MTYRYLKSWIDGKTGRHTIRYADDRKIEGRRADREIDR